MEKKVVDYQLVEENNASSLSRRIQDYLDTGFELYGNPGISIYKGYFSFVQAVVKYETVLK